MKRYSLKFKFWPEPDRKMWEAVVAVCGLLDGAGPGMHWSDETKSVLVRDYGYWLPYVFSAETGAVTEGPMDRVTPARVRGYCLSMNDVSALTASNPHRSAEHHRAQCLSQAGLAVACHHVPCP